MYLAGKAKAFTHHSLRLLFACALIGWSFRIPAFALKPGRQLSQAAHSVWRIQDGFFGSQPNAITQTTDGYIWIGTQSGLLRFDGVRFVPWMPPPEKPLPSAEITALLGGS